MDLKYTKVSIGLVIFGLLATVGGIYKIYSASERKNWPSVQAQITRAGVREQIRTSRGSGRRFVVDIRYEFYVGNKKINPSSTFLGYESREEAQEVYTKHLPGKKLEVFYDPDEPTRTSLSKDATADEWQLLMAGLLMIVGGLVVGWWAGRSSSRPGKMIK